MGGDMDRNKRMAQLSAPSLLRWLLGVGWDWGVIVLALVLARYLNHPMGYILAVFVVGNRQHALELIGHDAAHYLVCRRRWLNEFAGGFFCFWPLISGLGTYRKFHFSHHAHLGTLEDPEQKYKRWSPAHWDLPAPRRQIPKFFLLDLLGLSSWELLRLFMATQPPTLVDWVGPMLWHGAAVLACWWTGRCGFC
jgi:fatty acid desaturase